MKIKKEKYTIKQFNEQYPSDDACLHSVFLNRYSNISACTKCGADFSFHKIADRKCYTCAHCGYQIHPLAGTIFHKSSTPLQSWFFAIFLFSASKNGVAAKELERKLGVTYKCAHRMAGKIRTLFAETVNPLDGEVEIDETYMGGKEKNKHFNKRTENARGRSTKAKTPIVGAVQRQGNVIARVVTDTKSATLMPFVRSNIKITAEIKTDEYTGYAALNRMGYKHGKVTHSRHQYVDGNSHTNTVEGFWSQLKRSINGTYHHVSSKHLQQYVNEFSYRYNRRNQVQPMFTDMIKQVWTLC